jgi:diguanylate cyclase (GGDEF)-like protein
VHTDITLRKRSEEEIRRLAFYDPLTELPNRRLLLERLGQMQANLARNQELGAVLFLDLDRFKALNDTLGHALGDALLQQVAKRLLCCVREMDTVARLGGDEFVVALAQLGTDLQAARVGASGVAHKILRALAEPFDLGGGATWQLSASVGLALLHDPQLPVESALQAADTAMYAAKADGRNAVRLA